jgi:hypothetical protein
MPITSPPAIPGQIVPSGVKPYTSQGAFSSAIGEVQSWNPNASSVMIGQWINNAVRKFYDRRNWYGLLTRGQIVTPRYYSVGQIAVTLGSTAIVGFATTFTPDMVGRSLRVGFNNPIYNIIAVADATHLTLDLPWGGQSYSNIGYFIVKYYYSIPNIRYILTAVNLQMQQRLVTNLTQVSLNSIDPSRQSGGVFSWGIAAMPPDPDGNYQFELYPAARAQQAIPYVAYVQPPNLVNDNDNLPPFMRWDIIKSHAISDCLRFRTKDNPNYSEAIALQIADTKLKEFETEAVRAEQADENLYRQDIILDFEQYPMFTPGGAFWDISHAVSAGGNYE